MLVSRDPEWQALRWGDALLLQQALVTGASKCLTGWLSIRRKATDLAGRLSVTSHRNQIARHIVRSFDQRCRRDGVVDPEEIRGIVRRLDLG